MVYPSIYLLPVPVLRHRRLRWWLALTTQSFIQARKVQTYGRQFLLNHRSPMAATLLDIVSSEKCNKWPIKAEADWSKHRRVLWHSLPVKQINYCQNLKMLTHRGGARSIPGEQGVINFTGWFIETNKRWSILPDDKVELGELQHEDA